MFEDIIIKWSNDNPNTLVEEEKPNCPGHKSPIDDLVKALRDDPGYRQSWHANISVAFQDAYITSPSKKDYIPMSQFEIKTMADTAADNFLNLLIGKTPDPTAKIGGEDIDGILQETCTIKNEKVTGDTHIRYFNHPINNKGTYIIGIDDIGNYIYDNSGMK